MSAPAPIIAAEAAVHTITFSGILAATSQGTRVSGGIGFRYRIKKVKVYCDWDHDLNVRHYILVGSTNQGSTTNIPEGTNVLSPLSPDPYLIGRGHAREIALNLIVNVTTSYLKLHVQNLNGWQITYYGEVEIERL